MMKIYLQKIVQFSTSCYIGKIDPRKLVLVSEEIEMGEIQEAQRPLSKKKVKEIAKYISEESGMLPNTITIATKDDRLSVELYDKEKGIYALNFPETKEEYEHCKNSIDVMDGQHRLYSFRSDIMRMKDRDPYEIGFVLYIKPTLTDRQSIFTICNEKQEKVNSNLLMWFKKQLNLLSLSENEYHNLVEKLNNEYPLKGRIILSAEPISGGFKAQQVIDALKNAHINDITKPNGVQLSENEKVKVICRYLSSWERVCSFKFSAPRVKTVGAATKMAGLRYMLLLLKPIWDRCISSKTKFEDNQIESIIRQMIDALGHQPESFFVDDVIKMWFRDRTAITNGAKISENTINHLGSESFDPLEE